MKKSFMGKVLGFGIGFLYGGPVGAFLGLILGVFLDKRVNAIHRVTEPRLGPNPRYAPPEFGDSAQQSAYTLGVIVLGAKMAKADGQVTRQEIEAFKKAFNVPADQLEAVARIFDEAKQSVNGFEPYAAKLSQVFRTTPAVLEEVLTGLFQIALAEGPYLTRMREAYLRRVTALFGFASADFARIAARSGVRQEGKANTQTVGGIDDSYAVLGIGEATENAEIKRAYYALIRKHHPDKLAAQGMPPELVAQANEKMKRINAAYDKISKIKGIK